MKHKRLLLKLSGESLLGKDGSKFDYSIISQYVVDIKQILDEGCQLAIVIGAGNFIRGLQSYLNINRVKLDYMGILSTVINGLVLQSFLEKINIKTVLHSSIRIDKITELYVNDKSIRYLNQGYVVIFVAGLGHPYFTTDTAAVLRAIEIEADMLLKGTKVDYIYDKDPYKFNNAKKIKKISFQDALFMKLHIMDTNALVLGSENNLPIVVFNIKNKGNLLKIIQGDYNTCSLITK